MFIALPRSCEEFQTIRSYKHFAPDGAKMFYLASGLASDQIIAYPDALFTRNSRLIDSRLETNCYDRQI